MEQETRAFLNSLYPYFKILEKVNNDYCDLTSNNGSREMHENAELMYTLITNIVRLLPVRIPYKKSWLTDYKEMTLQNDGILLLADHIDFLAEEYKKIIEHEKCKFVLSRAVFIRNKYTHAPHTVHFSFSVGGQRSFAGGVYYEDTLLSVSTIWLSNIVCDLNIVFDRIRELFISTVDALDPKYKEHPYYQKISTYHFGELNRRYGNMPWDWIETDPDREEYERLMNNILKESVADGENE